MVSAHRLFPLKPLVTALLQGGAVIIATLAPSWRILKQLSKGSVVAAAAAAGEVVWLSRVIVTDAHVD
jgi:hypothetical protein